MWAAVITMEKIYYIGNKKTTLIHIIYQRTNYPNLRLAYWIYILFSTDSYDKLYTFVDSIDNVDNIDYLNNNNTIAATLAKLCYQIFKNPNGIIPDPIKTELKKITGAVEYINNNKLIIK